MSYRSTNLEERTVHHASADAVASSVVSSPTSAEATGSESVTDQIERDLSNPNKPRGIFADYTLKKVWVECNSLAEVSLMNKARMTQDKDCRTIFPKYDEIKSQVHGLLVKLFSVLERSPNSGKEDAVERSADFLSWQADTEKLIPNISARKKLIENALKLARGEDIRKLLPEIEFRFDGPKPPERRPSDAPCELVQLMGAYLENKLERVGKNEKISWGVLRNRDHLAQLYYQKHSVPKEKQILLDLARGLDSAIVYAAHNIHNDVSLNEHYFKYGSCIKKVKEALELDPKCSIDSLKECFDKEYPWLAALNPVLGDEDTSAMLHGNADSDVRLVVDRMLRNSLVQLARNLEPQKVGGPDLDFFVDLAQPVPDKSDDNRLTMEKN